MGNQRQHKSSRWLICCLVLAAMRPAIAGNAATDLPVSDLIPDLFNFLSTAPKEKEERARLFAQLIIQPHPEIYSRPDVFRTDLPALELYLDGLTSYLPAIQLIHQRIEEQRASIEAKFMNAFPDFKMSKARLYLMLSLFRFDGRIPHDNPRMLLLGLDGIAKFHGADAQLSVILSHELFHVYHFQVNPLPYDTDNIPLYRLIWQEGLATFVSQVLNPEASLSDVLLDPRLASEGPGFIAEMAASLLHDLTSVDDLTAGRYLSYRRVGPMPSRMGYLIGYEVVKRAATDHSLADLARLRGGALLALVRAQTQALASGTPNTQ
jgi:Predicted Zn-dependent protease (DUF2268)